MIKEADFGTFAKNFLCVCWFATDAIKMYAKKSQIFEQQQNSSFGT